MVDANLRVRRSVAGHRRAATVVLLVGVVLVLIASPAAADPAGPTHYDSVVTAVEDPSGATSFEVLGGDAFLVVRAEPGFTVEIPGYSGEPYVRIEPDGTVLVNERSESRWANDERYGVGTADMPPIVDNDAPPSWLEVGTGGEYAWHDHRIHYMSPSLPRHVDPGAGTPQEVWDWTVPFLVDGQPAEVTGVLSWLPGPSPVVPVGLAVVLAALALALVLRWPAALLPLLGIGVLTTAAVGFAKIVDLPLGADAEPVLLVLPVIAAAVAVLGALLSRRRTSAAMLVPAAGIPLLVWAILQAGAFTRPIVPGPLAVEVVRVAVAVALAVGLAALAVIGRQVAAATRIATDGSERSDDQVAGSNAGTAPDVEGR